MNSFIQAHMAKVTGILSGWDRLRFRGTIRMLANVPGLWRFLRSTGRVLLKDFGKHAEELSQATRNQSLAVAEAGGRPVVHLHSPSVCKERCGAGDSEADAAEGRRRSGRVTRQLWLLRAHGIIRKGPRTHRYHVTTKGRQLITALQAAREADVTKLASAA